ncbi:Bardet-Biedl syndrome 1 protein [Eumeta japonica]|uniref:Bardet-Biedl syndrome 1 protein n=1 Tax=Eumeta variegata TaxID=151549 RepID=A0A4C1ZB04_EUMVA|nr:Bardet-Biedl syndrome 1 protein [Eumeta japonica]
MHESFQMDLQKLRLTAAKTLLEAHEKSENTFGVGVLEPLRLSAEIEGLGPVFRVVLIVENTSTEKAVMDLAILFHMPATNYRVSNPYIKVPLLAPGGKLKFPTKVEERFDDVINPDVLFRDITGDSGESSLLRMLLLKNDKIVLAATARLPPTDPFMLPYDKIQATAAFI